MPESTWVWLTELKEYHNPATGQSLSPTEALALGGVGEKLLDVRVPFLRFVIRRGGLAQLTMEDRDALLEAASAVGWKGGPGSGWYAPPKGTHGSGSPALTVSSLDFEVTDAHSGEMYGYIAARNTAGERLGHLDWSEYQGTVYVQMVKVKPEARRRGIATEMYGRLKEEFPDAKIEWGMATPEGTALRESIEKQGIKGGKGSGHRGHRGRPGERGGSVPGSRLPSAHVLDSFKDEYTQPDRVFNVERGLIVNPETGETVQELNKGTERRLVIPPSTHLEGNTLTHYHPPSVHAVDKYGATHKKGNGKDGISQPFSRSDVQLAVMENMAEIRAVGFYEGKPVSFRMTRPKGGWPNLLGYWLEHWTNHRISSWEPDDDDNLPAWSFDVLNSFWEQACRDLNVEYEVIGV